MEVSQTILLTGATSGLGLNTVRQLARRSNSYLIVGARNPTQALELQAAMPKERLTILPLDLSSVASVRRFATATMEQLGDRRLTALALNAGTQIVTGLEKTIDGYERTFASNHLGHFLLTCLLLPVLADGAVVVSTASGTHAPTDRISKQFGFRGGFFPDAEAVASGTLDDSVSILQQGLDRYATSKLCNLLFTYDMARRISPAKVRFVAFDPGLMPGTGLARDRTPLERFAWQYILPSLRWFIPGVSSPKQSAKSLAHLLTQAELAPLTGQHFDYRLRLTATSNDSHRKDWQQALHDLSIRLSSIDVSELKGVRPS
ncbi:MAG: SDR family NAD(P)-dependent oxidoreductase [Cyanobacteria bacterium J06626_6]